MPCKPFDFTVEAATRFELVNGGFAE